MARLTTLLLLIAIVLSSNPRAIANGTADPAALIATGAVIPFFAEGDNVSFLEISSPTTGFNPMVVVFFDATCTKVQGLLHIQDANNLDIIDLKDPSLDINFNGLAVIAGLPLKGGTELEPGATGLRSLSAPIHARMHWMNLTQGFHRTLEPIAIETEGSSATWSPLRTGATLHIPLQTADTQTTLIFVCPTAEITGCDKCKGGHPLVRNGPRLDGSGDKLILVAYDLDGAPQWDVLLTCQCLSSNTAAALQPDFGDANFFPEGAYVEVRGEPFFPGAGIEVSRPFTGYVANQFSTGDDFYRFRTGNALRLFDGDPNGKRKR